jgi:hypothetical protein
VVIETCAKYPGGRTLINVTDITVPVRCHDNTVSTVLIRYRFRSPISNIQDILGARLVP